ncbi:hypothetical protein PT974_00665 [Cladobotryum mycophilum]|uniref:Transcription-silencing protein Clr2 n=1 Tax=Cladobotryum mycophilum TaxID=491253 RepID=A0ABR0T1H7_9HYPO
MADTKEFDVIRITRSDGADTGPGYWPVTAPAATNAAKKPSKEASSIEKTPRAKPQMIRLAEDDPRFAEWRIKLGILLKQELSPNPDEGNSWYVHFPRGYWLYEKSKHLWVSGYPIKAKLFKSPQEFGVHLIWLLSTSKAYVDCCCVHCNAPNPAKLPGPDEPMASTTLTETQPKVEKQALPKVTPVPLPAIPGQPIQKPPSALSRLVQQTQPIQSVQPVQPFQTTQQIAPPQPTKPTPQPQPTPTTITKPPTPISAAPITAPPQPQPLQARPQAQSQPQLQPQHQSQPQAQPQSQLQQSKLQSPTWVLKTPHTFRAGELVWYQTGNTWRLGVISAPTMGLYDLVPLGHGMVMQQNVSKPEADLRPFHCYSVPNVDVAELKEKTFDEVPWDAMFRAAGTDVVRRDQINLDASKMAASKIDSSYSLWTRRSEDNATPMMYYGCFFGAERIELGDCVRIKGGELNTNQTAILGLCHIFTADDYVGQVFFRGHVYHLSKGPASTGTVMPEDKLPIALRDEIQWRKSIAPNQQWCVILIRENVVLKEQSVRGRFYPTHRLLPLYNPVEYRNLVTSGQLRDQHVYLNNRMDGGGRYIGRKRNRMETLGASVPHAARLAVEQHVVEEP